jgi:hypothetical protein
MTEMDGDAGPVGKPFAGFDDFDDCVQEFDDDASVDDPQALCGWLEENRKVVSDFDPDGDKSLIEFVRSLDDPETDTVLTDLEVSFVSTVETPAQDSQWLYAKDTDHDVDWGVNSPLVVAKDADVDADINADEHGDGPEEQKAWAPVLIPNEADKQGDVIPPAEIEDAAHTFLKDYRQIDSDHDLMEGKGKPIESWTLKEDTEFELPNGEESRQYPPGTWMLGVQFSDEPWDRIKQGELTGFSIYGEAEPMDVSAVIGKGIDYNFDTDPEGIRQEVLQNVAKQDFEGPCWEGYTMVGTKVENGNEVPNCVPDEDVPDAQQQSMTEQDNEAEVKNLPDEKMVQLAEIMRGYFDDHGGTVVDSDLEELLDWGMEGRAVEDLDDVVEIGDVEIPVRPEEESEEDGMHEEDMADEGMDGEKDVDNDKEETEMSDTESDTDDEQDEQDEPTIKDVMETVEETSETVKDTQDTIKSIDNRVDDLEAEVFGKDEESEEASGVDADTIQEEAEKALAKSLGLDGDDLEDADDRTEVIRKNLHEVDNNSSGSTVDEWDPEEIEAGFGGGN